MLIVIVALICLVTGLLLGMAGCFLYLEERLQFQDMLLERLAEWFNNDTITCDSPSEQASIAELLNTYLRFKYDKGEL